MTIVLSHSLRKQKSQLLFTPPSSFKIFHSSYVLKFDKNFDPAKLVSINIGAVLTKHRRRQTMRAAYMEKTNYHSCESQSRI
jgi:hypothetical protein